MAKLTERQKRYIVGRLAAYDTPSEVVTAVKEELGLEISRQAVQHYDPTTHQGSALKKELQELFWELRERFREETDGIPIAHRSFRLKERERLYRRALQYGHIQLAESILDGAAREMGGAFTNHRVLQGGEDPIRVEHVDEPRTREERERVLIAAGIGATG